MECDGCTLCCKLLPVPWMNSPANEYCKECNPGIGCKIWDNIPEGCLKYSCAYNQIEKCSEDLKPSNCKVMFEMIGDNIFLGIIDPEQIFLTDAAKGQISSFVRQGFSVILLHEKTNPYIFTDKKRSADEVWQIYQEKLNRLDGSTKLYN